MHQSLRSKSEGRSYFLLPTSYFFRKGFTMLELLISIGVLVILSSIGAAVFVRQIRTTVLDTTAREIALTLRKAQQNSLAQEESVGWGVHFDNPPSATPFYVPFASSTYSVGVEKERKFLDVRLTFSAPASGTSTNVIFNKLTGLPVATATITVQLKSDTAQSKSITVNAAGTINLP